MQVVHSYAKNHKGRDGDERSLRNHTKEIQREFWLHGADIIGVERPRRKWRLKCLVGRDRCGERQVRGETGKRKEG